MSLSSFCNSYEDGSKSQSDRGAAREVVKVFGFRAAEASKYVFLTRQAWEEWHALVMVVERAKSQIALRMGKEAWLAVLLR
jgi:hypothetical protein